MFIGLLQQIKSIMHTYVHDVQYVQTKSEYNEQTTQQLR
jgi:hypothetical protein